MLTDDERTLQVLEWTRDYGGAYPSRLHPRLCCLMHWETTPLVEYVERSNRYRLTNAGRAKLSELREKKGKC